MENLIKIEVDARYFKRFFSISYKDFRADEKINELEVERPTGENCLRVKKEWNK